MEQQGMALHGWSMVLVEFSNKSVAQEPKHLESEQS